ncbi:hypothetical protein EYF80_052654 [Liparis tanakae]|uniref:Uncharacterized protein n=1 Tax=Liparis tanakae TaxID=230148 RepID=A0A4Z2F8R3_9TELE|nr:hypothetical protein EYF80_052654 [Liparis tanakae]
MKTQFEVVGSQECRCERAQFPWWPFQLLLDDVSPIDELREEGQSDDMPPDPQLPVVHSAGGTAKRELAPEPPDPQRALSRLTYQTNVDCSHTVRPSRLKFHMHKQTGEIFRLLSLRISVYKNGSLAPPRAFVPTVVFTDDRLT